MIKFIGIKEFFSKNNFLSILILVTSLIFVIIFLFFLKSLEKKDALIYVIQPMTNLKILPTTSFYSGSASEEISIVASKEEYKPASFVISALKDISKLQIKITDLKSKEGIISSNNIDIFVVKPWYQSGSDTIANENKSVLVPELLLKDDSLVKVDYKNRENFIKIRENNKETYVSISKKNNEGLESFIINKTTPNNWGRPHATLMKLPIQDTKILQPIDIEKGTNKQIWITVHVPQDSSPGIYKGDIEFQGADVHISKIKFNLKVLPFELEPPLLTYSIYYMGKLSPDNEWYISSEIKSEEQFLAEMKDLKAHGVLYPTLEQPMWDKHLLERAIQLRDEAGLPKDIIYFIDDYWGSISRPPSSLKSDITFEELNPILNIPYPYFAKPGITSEELEPLREKVRSQISFFKEKGYNEIYSIYAIDEATGEMLLNQRPAFKAVHEAGGKVFGSGSTYGRNFEIVGDLQDLLNSASTLSKEEADKWHSANHKIFSYGNPQVGYEDPTIYRKNYGLLLWQNNYDGAMDFAYQCGFGNVWNDFDDPKLRDLNFTYPTMDGVIDTIAWEGFREGVDDVRYLSTLLKAIENAKKSENKELKKEALSAEKWLEELKELNLETTNLDFIRSEMITYILKLTSK